MKPTVIGAGNWGTALANLLAKKGIPTKIYAYEREVTDGINQKRMNPLFLTNINLSQNITAFNEIREAVKGSDTIIMATPTQFYRHTMEKVTQYISEDTPIISAVKGIENDSLMLISQITADVRKKTEGDKFAVLSGPTFAEEVAAEKPTAAVIASRDKSIGTELRSHFSTKYFRLYFNEDITGVQLGGALKNIFAIACGITSGLGLGYNSQAALISRGNAEMARLAVKLGANPKTLSGLAGIGDLILTSTSSLSRNRTLGSRLAKGETLEQILSTTVTIAEGVRATSAAYQLAKKTKTDMPIVEALYHILYMNKPVEEALNQLMGRPLKDEFWE
jgi:glycerol-3-phosphate dehydrogenase (NAD(P)+)